MVDVADWYVRLSEPVRAPPSRRHDYAHFLSRSTFTNFEILRGWYRPLTEPVRRKPPLPVGALPFTFRIINMVEYRFALTEQGDTGTFLFTTSPAPRNMAQVTITEIPPDRTQVTVETISYKRRYY